AELQHAQPAARRASDEIADAQLDRRARKPAMSLAELAGGVGFFLRLGARGEDYQLRGFPRPRSPPPPPPPPKPPRPPPPPPPPPNPPPERGLSWASFTRSARPSRSLPSSSAIAALASASDPIVTNANPRGRPVSRSLGMATSLTVRPFPLNAA